MHKHVHQNHHHDHDHVHHLHHHQGVGHNHVHPHDHLHSHIHTNTDKERAEEIKVLATSFVEGFKDAKDKNSYLRLAGIPFQREGKDGLTLNLVDASIVGKWQLGTASPAFASRELIYMPFPGEMIDHRETMTFTYVSLTSREDIDLIAVLVERMDHSN